MVSRTLGIAVAALVCLSGAAFASDMEQASMYGATEAETCAKAKERATTLMSVGSEPVRPGSTPVEHSCDCVAAAKDKAGKTTEYSCLATVWINAPGASKPKEQKRR